MEHLRRIHFHIVIIRWIYSLHAVCFFQDHLALHRQIHQIFFNMLQIHFQQLSCPACQKFLIQKNMSCIHSLKQCIKYSTADPIIRIRMNTDSLRDLIRSSESHPADMIRHLVRILFQHTVNPIAIILINLCCQCRRNTIFLQIDHRLTHILLLFYLLCDLSCLAFTDAFDLCQPLRFFLYNSKCIFFKLSHNPPCQCSADSTDCP